MVKDLYDLPVPVDACQTVGHGVAHDTTSAEWFMEDSLPQIESRRRSRRRYRPVRPRLGAGGILAYPANPAGSSAAGTFDSNANAVSGCTSG